MNIDMGTRAARALRMSLPVAFLLGGADASAQGRAFPGAIGFGTETEAGRHAAAADIYEVTRLDDDFKNPAVGTLRYGMEKIPRPRVIVFASRARPRR